VQKIAGPELVLIRVGHGVALRTHLLQPLPIQKGVVADYGLVAGVLTAVVAGPGGIVGAVALLAPARGGDR
jgi:hypothetical protein